MYHEHSASSNTVSTYFALPLFFLGFSLFLNLLICRQLVQPPWQFSFHHFLVFVFESFKSVASLAHPLHSSFCPGQVFPVKTRGGLWKSEVKSKKTSVKHASTIGWILYLLDFLVSNGGSPFVLANLSVILLQPLALLFRHFQVESRNSGVELPVKRHPPGFQVVLEPLDARHLLQEGNGAVRSFRRHSSVHNRESDFFSRFLSRHFV